jgi:hypothetical protein
MGMTNVGDFQADTNFFYATQMQAMKDLAAGSIHPHGMQSHGPDDSMKESQQNPWGGLQVNPDRGGRVIDLEMTAEDPFIARDKLRLYIKEYIEIDKLRKEEIINSILSKLKTEVKQAEDRMLNSQKELIDFSKEHGKVFGDYDPDLAGTFLDAATRKVVGSRNERLDLETLSLHKQMILPRTIDNQYIRRLRESSAALKGEYLSASSALGPGHVHGAEHGRIGAGGHAQDTRQRGPRHRPLPLRPQAHARGGFQP